ncbi:Predicted membrane protein [Nocardioides exalbidus]|uniref:Predicted membrane protein n=1 Tax=Nocardioides exalbidus TaxID=402596 RepID=A0A1H4I3Z7_9ACTN|nr:DUF2142 domain-containing protein [Nocardioides exalbidus]SEB28640.1 Predicted membrane protein [Nocardioides exalbidus]
MTHTTTDRIRPIARRFAARPDAVALLAAALLFLVGAQIALVFKVPSWGNDEPAHTGYVASLAAGHLPTIDTDIVDDPARFPGTAEELQGWDAAHGDIWTANHPPLFHLAMVPVWWALHDVNQSGMIITMRLANTLGFAAWLYLVGALARELVPRRPAVAALAVVVAAAPTLVLRSAFFQNDGWASASAVLLLLTTVRLLRRGATTPRVALAAAAGTVAAGTRAQGVLLVALCSVVLLVVLARRSGWRPDGWKRALVVSGVVGAVPAAAWAWFYVRNYRLYGDVTGQDALLEKFDRVPVTEWHRIDNIPGLTEPTLATPILIGVFLVLVPIALVRSVRRHGARLDAVWILLAVHALVTLQSLVTFMQAGGGFHDRYLMQVMPLLATAVAVGMLEVGRWVRARTPGTVAAERRDWWVATAWASVLLVWLAGAVAWLEDYYVFSRQETSPVDGPVPDAMVAVAVGLGVALVTVMVGRARALDRRDDVDRPAELLEPVEDDRRAFILS